jgi:iron complex transport system permease protein
MAALGFTGLLLCAAGIGVGSVGWEPLWDRTGSGSAIVWQIRLPRTLGALLVGALLGLAGALAQGLFRNPLADPYLLGTAAGAGLGVVLVLAAGGLLGQTIGLSTADLLQRLGLVGGAFAGAAAGVALTLVLARGTARPLVLLLSGVVVGVLLSAVAELVMLVSPEALRGRQVFLLGSTAFVGWPSVVVLVATLALCLPPALLLARVLDALVLGEATAASLGLALVPARLLLVALMALATATAVAQAGLVAFVGLIAPHVVRRLVVVTHGPLLGLSAAAGAVLLLAADIAARGAIAPQELPVGVLTAVLGGAYLMVLLRRRTAA